MMQLITPEFYGEFAGELKEMHGLRYRVFKEKLDWEVDTKDQMEADALDGQMPVYLLLRGFDWRIRGCVRLLPSTGPTRVRDTFPVLLGAHILPSTPDIWKSRRFALDFPASAPTAARGLAQVTYELFAGMIEFGLAKDLTQVVTITDMRMERILRCATWPLSRIALPQPSGKTRAVAGFLEISDTTLRRIRRRERVSGPVLWQPVLERSV
ncbi:conjugal transfer protein TraI [Mesorhizobium loti]|uniref:Acyl-homoserine-lactone synthase n=1 Tax=Rhizobium loti TaxID=381 RepID=A0A101KTZ9_RHILI|nr:conjugal transfer protein TraI [Mesorhizobium loti]